MRQLTPFALLVALPAFAHDVEEEHSALETLGWGAEWWVLALLALSLLLYLAGLRRLWPRTRNARAEVARHAASFVAGWCVLALALASPLDPAGSLAFSAHMVQHELLMIVAAPLMVLGRPLGIWVWALPPVWRTRVGGFTRASAVAWTWDTLTAPLASWMLHFAALWLWHVPSLFQRALASNGIHALQHASFLVTALLFWWAVLGKRGLHAGSGFALAYLFTTMMHTGALGALFTMSDNLWYPAYGASAQAFGLAPIEDQQLGGLIMWIPGGLAYVAAALALAAGWLRSGRSAATMGGMR